VSKARRWFTTFCSLLSIALLSIALTSTVVVAQQKTSTPSKAKQEVQKQKESTAPKKGEQPSENAPAGKAAKDDEKPKDPFSSPTFSGLKLRSIGPAVTSGRVLDIAVNPKNRAAISLYEKFGFAKVGEILGYFLPGIQHDPV